MILHILFNKLKIAPPSNLAAIVEKNLKNNNLDFTYFLNSFKIIFSLC